jgi:ABC-type uncharacterized transport system ATPase subunit
MKTLKDKILEASMTVIGEFGKPRPLLMTKSGKIVDMGTLQQVLPEVQEFYDKPTNMTTIELLTTMRHKGAAWQSQEKAEATLMKLKMHLTEVEFRDLQIAHNHYQIGEGAREFYDEVNKLIEKYTNKKE